MKTELPLTNKDIVQNYQDISFTFNLKISIPLSIEFKNKSIYEAAHELQDLIGDDVTQEELFRNLLKSSIDIRKHKEFWQTFSDNAGMFTDDIEELEMFCISMYSGDKTKDKEIMLMDAFNCAEYLPEEFIDYLKQNGGE